MEQKLSPLVGKRWILKFGKHAFPVFVKEVRRARIKDMKNPVYDEIDGRKTARKMTMVACDEGNLFFEEGDVEYTVHGIEICYDSYRVCFSYSE